ncbi:DNA polymerase III subunit gamma/tau [Candidatus Hepatincolaceae symbiont of Richtersius coronifer]
MVILGQPATNYINLARKYRPQIIADLIGQEPLVKTLENAFKLNKIAHAFMLTGVRGVGKTTTARIIAKALSCTGIENDGNITLAPCGVCDNCKAITEDRHLDVIEIDAASKTGVDDVREIIENSKYRPIMARYKIFIIDEVHMLSKNAFNALLKTLEEPPQHLKFIFATTEIKKIPITVLSRCQRFDLRRVQLQTLAKHLTNICNKENIKFDEQAIFLLAKAGNGSVRDCLSLLDQAIVFCDSQLTETKIIEMLGQGAIEDIYNLFLHLVNNNPEQSFAILDQQYNKGVDLEGLIEDLLEVCHNCILISMLSHNLKIIHSNIQQLSELEKQKTLEITKVANLILLNKIWQILLSGLKNLKHSNQQIQLTNIIITNVLLVNNLKSINDILNDIKHLEKSSNFSDSKKNKGDPGPHPTHQLSTVQPSTLPDDNILPKEVLVVNESHTNVKNNTLIATIAVTPAITTPPTAIKNLQKTDDSYEEINEVYNDLDHQNLVPDSYPYNPSHATYKVNASSQIIDSSPNKPFICASVKEQPSIQEKRQTEQLIKNKVATLFPTSDFIGYVEE